MIKYWIKKYSTAIIIFLLAILLMKNCKSCTSERRNKYNIMQIELLNKTKLDSINSSLKESNYKYDSLLTINKYLLDSLHNISYENKVLKTIISEIKTDKEYYKKQNINLVNMAKNFTNKKDTIK